MQKEDHRRQLSLRKRTTLLWELILSPSLGADASCLPVQTDGLLEVWIIRLPEDGVRAEFVHQTAAQHGQEHFAFVIVPMNSEKNMFDFRCWRSNFYFCFLVGVFCYLIARLSFSYVMRGLFLMVPHKLANFSL